MIGLVWRTIVIYLFVILTLRLMGKRQIGELEASELVVTIIISEIAALPITDTKIPLHHVFLPIGILLVMEHVISYLAYRSVHIRSALYGKPSMLYQKGKLNQKEMRRQRFNLGDLMEELRNQGVISLSQVDYVIMETNGKISVILRSEESPLTPKSQAEPEDNSDLNYVLVDNGHLMKKRLKQLGLNQNWLKKQLKQHKLSSYRQVYYLSFDKGTGETVVIPKEK
ncbi:MAG: DUF421 domain-containing protein [Clostridia bacterium]|nr:DUF421 domain-containing protein [Clostridia bacterium]